MRIDFKKYHLKALLFRQVMLDRFFSNLYGSPMQVLPKGHAGLAAAVVLWFVQDGARQVIMIRNPKAKDNRFRLVSCFGLGKHPDMSAALTDALELQLGNVFARTIDKTLLLPDRVLAAPAFTYTDEDTGITSPVQVLAWAIQIQPVQADLIQTGGALEMAVLNERTLENPLGVAAGTVSPTHRAIWLSLQRHLPRMKGSVRSRSDAVEEVSVENGEVRKGAVRTVH